MAPSGGGDCVKIGITCYPTYGGSGAIATELGIALAQRGHEIHFITYQQPFRLPRFLPRIYFHEVDVGRYPLFEYPPYDLALAVRMHEVVLTHNLDLLHVHYAIPHATSAWIAREMLQPTRPDIKVLTTLHGRHHDRRPGSVVLPDHQVLDREVGRTDRGLELPALRNAVGLRLHGLPDRSHPELHRSRRLRPQPLRTAASPAA